MTELITLPIVAGGVGAGVATANLQAKRTIQVTSLEGTVIIEASNDGGLTWCQVASFSGSTEDQVKTVAAGMMRVNATSGNAGEVQIVAERGLIRTGVIPSPPVSGAGASLIVSQFGCLSTFIVQDFDGNGSVNIEVSGDGVEWSTAASFQGNGCKTIDISALFVRAMGNNATATLSMGSEEPAVSALTSPCADFVFTETKPNGGNVYTDWEELLDAANALFDETGCLPRVVFDVEPFGAITIPAPAVPGTVYDVHNLYFYNPSQFALIFIEDGNQWNGAPKIGSRFSSVWIFDVESPVIDTSRPEHEQDPPGLACLEGQHFMNCVGSSVWWRQTPDVFLGFAVCHAEGFVWETNNHFTFEADSIFEFDYPQGTSNLHDDLFNGSGLVIFRVSCNSWANFPEEFSPHIQPNFTGKYSIDPPFLSPAKRWAFPPADNEFGGKPVVRGQALQSDDISFTAATSIIETAGALDFSTLNDGDTILVTGSASNDGTYTIVGAPSATQITVAEALANEAAGATVTVTQAHSAGHGFRILFNDLAIETDDITFTATDTIVTGGLQDFSRFRPGDTIEITGSASNDGIYTVVTANATTITVTNGTIANEVAGADVTVALAPVAVVLPSTAGQSGQETSIHNFGTVNAVTVVPVNSPTVEILNDPGSIAAGKTGRYEVVYAREVLFDPTGTETDEAYCASVSA